MAREADIVRLFEEAERALGPITHLVNSAGTGGRTRVDEYDAALLEKLFAINAIGVMLCCREAARRMSTRHGGKGGAIVNVSSMASTIGGRLGSAAYAATKGAVDSFTKGFAREVGCRGHPGQCDPAGHGADRDDRRHARGAGVPRPHRGVDSDAPRRREPRDRRAILWLLSDEASFITGAMVDAAGGGYII